MTAAVVIADQVTTKTIKEPYRVHSALKSEKKCKKFVESAKKCNLGPGEVALSMFFNVLFCPFKTFQKR